MATMIDKVKVAGATNIATAGYKTLLILALNAASGADDYEGTAEEAATFKEDVVITVGDSSTGVGAVEIDAQYVKVRTQADSKYAFVEVVLADAYVSTITLPADVTTVGRVLTQPDISEV